MISDMSYIAQTSSTLWREAEELGEKLKSKIAKIWKIQAET